MDQSNQKKPKVMAYLEERAAARRELGIHLQKIEQNPLTDDDIAMFEMFDREGFSPDERRDYIIRQTLAEIGK